MAADPQVVALGDVVGQHHPGTGPQPGQHGQQHIALQRLCLVDDDERVMQRAAPDVGQRQHLEHATGQHFLEHRRAGQPLEGVEDRLRPRAHLLALATGQVAQLLAADRVQRAEDHHLAVGASLQHGFQTRTQRQSGLARAGFAAQRHDAHRLIEQQIQRHPLLGGAATQTERLTVTSHQLNTFMRIDPAQRVGTAAQQPNPGVTR
ncbi:Uncharacterised protein [Mycobacterium tuberculosis]|nr:Uncharacterised protein [Mycobacterium tuberculosis]CNW99891.1 Uncharacterised protein [Mycobacterium tuberculosis]CNX32804.1 Uncharacterised protein [Mycobacterium tuberculosis]SGE62353.1 Uncharacterised protein [Mycobacterium tuberculosis]SGF28378.1 Uncharacterised protein [Mycobacterium tuberculosis]